MAFAGLGWLTYSVKPARKPSVPLQSSRWPSRGRSGVPVASRDGREPVQRWKQQAVAV